MVSLSLESISKQIEDISWRKENLRKSFEQLQPHSSALSLSLQWQEIEHYFDSIKKSIDGSFRDLQSKAHKQQQQQQQQQTKSTPQSQSQIDESIPHLESKHQKDESFSDLESKEARQKVFKLGLFRFQPQTIPENRPLEKRQRPEPGSDGLRYLITKSSSSLSTMYDKVAEKLRSSANPAKMAFDVIEGLEFCFYEGQWLVLEVLMKMASEMEITVAEVERKRALELVGRWKKIMRDINLLCTVLPEAFLKLVRAFELISDVGVDGLFLAFSRFENKERIRLFREFGLEEKAPDFIQQLIGENKHMVALEFVFAFKLGDKFPPSALLEEYLKEAKQQAQEMRRSGNGNPLEAYSATMTELTAMDLVMRYIKENNIKAESLQKSVVESISKLQKQAQKELIAAKGAPKPQNRKKLKKRQP
ncbi:putative FRIGIDA-like protein 1 [Cinnamomum micranthum f. kanehirae]|uniref:FRIGIDA-like protein n=1 Tax=Cinnamomum micranthum f. kanehirae TaxID=337451 RepID=A0A3S3MHK9_9MAGN|nr:putative FRIGIDA-like protein 1 [Cinnamomum micranthum f. kanehirae]